MGCDIHTYVETRKTSKHKWRLLNKEHFSKFDYSLKAFIKNSTSSPFSSRHYALFGVLAGVRYNDIKSFGKPKGIPDDVSYSVGKFWKAEEGDAHSASHLSVKELIEFNFFEEMEYDDSFYEEFSIHPHKFGNTFGNRVVCIEKERPKNIYMHKKYKQTLKAFIGELFFVQLDEMCDLHQDPENVRLVFWFDN